MRPATAAANKRGNQLANDNRTDARTDTPNNPDAGANQTPSKEAKADSTAPATGSDSTPGSEYWLP